MRLWFSHSSEVPIYRQLVTQVVLAIVAGDLRPGDRLPSTRELARRFALHPNTVSAGYRQLEREGWTERRHGSGVYVRARNDEIQTPEQRIDQHIAGFFRATRELGLDAAAVRTRVLDWLASPPPDHFVLIDPDAELRRILLTELRICTGWPVHEAAPEQCCDSNVLTADIPLCRPSQEKPIREVLPKGFELVVLPIRSATGWLSPWLPAPDGHLIGVVSHWPEFLDRARTMLVAARGSNLPRRAYPQLAARARAGHRRAVRQLYSAIRILPAETAPARLPPGWRTPLLPNCAATPGNPLSRNESSAHLCCLAGLVEHVGNRRKVWLHGPTEHFYGKRDCGERPEGKESCASASPRAAIDLAGEEQANADAKCYTGSGDQCEFRSGHGCSFHKPSVSGWMPRQPGGVVTTWP